MATEMRRRIRYGVVGLGHIAQNAVLPAFRNAVEYCELTALVSGDSEKLIRLGQDYGVKNLFSYDQYDQLLSSGFVDALYIALPNSLHREYTIKAAEAGIHVLCEKPMALNSQECQEMITACAEHQVKLMIAYRLHFEEANLKVIELIKQGLIGEPQIFSSVFTMQVREGNIRVHEETGGGALHDIGIYCLNAARNIFRLEPTTVSALVSNPPDARFKEVDGLTGALIEFGQGKVASFVCSFGAASGSSFQVVGTEGSIKVSPAYGYEEPLVIEVKTSGEPQRWVFEPRDQFAPELIRFAQCISNNEEPEASGEEGLADIRVIDALLESARSGQKVSLPPFQKRLRPSMQQELSMPSTSSKPSMIHVQPPSLGS